LNKRFGLLAAGGLAVALVAGGGTALAASSGGTAAAASAGPESSAGLITGCYTNAAVSGSHAVVLQDGGTTCPKGTSAISWNEQGPTGATGAQGATGPAGTNGANVVTSPGTPSGACNTGDTDIDLADGEVYTCTAAAWTDTGSSIEGSGFLSSDGQPTGSCTVGDSDVDYTTGEVYACQLAGFINGPQTPRWLDTDSSIAGPQGPQGPAGPGYTFTTGTGTLSPALTQDGTYSVDVEADIANTSPTASVIGYCTASIPVILVEDYGTDISPVISGAFVIPPGSNGDFSFSGILTLSGVPASASSLPGGGVQLYLSCSDSTGAAVTPGSIQWWMSPVATTS
jgi:hypothetical protein